MGEPINAVVAQVCITTHTPAETFALGVRLGKVITAGQVVALSGELGAGKTALTQGIAAGLGLKEQVTSPTFTLVNHYQISSNLVLSHIDLYRLPDEPGAAGDEAATFGLDEILTDPDAIVVIEWAERVASLLPADRFAINLVQPTTDHHLRQISIAALGPHSANVLNQVLDQRG